MTSLCSKPVSAFMVAFKVLCVLVSLSLSNLISHFSFLTHLLAVPQAHFWSQGLSACCSLFLYRVVVKFKEVTIYKILRKMLGT